MTPLASPALALAFLASLAPSHLAQAEAVAQEAETAEPQAPARTNQEPAPALPTVLDGLTVTRWASPPLVQNPTAIDIDARGRVWVTEGVRYRQWGGRNPGLEREHDRVVIVSDEDGDGVADTSKVFCEDERLTSPLGLLVLDDVVLVSCSPHLIAYYDDDHDDVADRSEVFLTGFGGFDHDHGLHSAVLGPDGSLYLAAGNAGPHIVDGSDGFQLRSGSIYSGGGPARADNKPGLVSSDGRAWTGGIMIRVERDGSGMAVLAHNFRNQYEIAVDPYGRMWTADNDDDGNRGCQARWVMPGGDHGYFSSDGSRSWQWDRRPGQITQRAHWHADDPGTAPLGAMYGSGSPTGVTFLSSGPMVADLGETLLTCDAGRGIVFAWKVVEDGAGWGLEERRLLEASDSAEAQASWFRPADVAVSPDGSLIVADWFDPAVGGHYAGDRESTGYLYRVVGSETQKIVEPNMDSAMRTIALLSSPVAEVRARALAKLEAEREEVTPLMTRIALQGTPSERADALWFLGSRDVGVVVEALEGAEDDRVRALCCAVLERHHVTEIPRLAREHGWAVSPHHGVRATVARSLEGVPVDECFELWEGLFTSHTSGDRAHLEALGAGARGQEEALWAELNLASGTQPLEWSPAFEEIAWRLHAEGAVDAWRGRALEARLDVEQRRRALDAIAFTPGQSAAEAMVSCLLLGPADLQSYATWWLESRDTNEWREYRLLDQLETGKSDLAKSVELWKSEPIEAGVVSVDVVLAEEAEVLWLVVDAEGGNGHDWADWIDPRLEVNGEIVSLSSIPWLSAEAGWGGVYVDRNANNSGPLSIEGRELRGIGTHAPSQISWKMPEGATRFLARAGIDDGGSKQAGANPRVHFEVRAELAPKKTENTDALVAFDAARPMEERVKAVEALAKDPRGGMALIKRAATKELEEELATAAADGLFSNPDPSVRALASAHFQRPGHKSARFPSIPELLELEGDPHAGRALFGDERAQCARCHAFEVGALRVGENIGPELTTIGKKFGKDGLFDAILNPSAAIAFGYETWMVETSDGEVLTGFLLADGELVVLKDTQGMRHAIPAENITYKEKQTLSTMPQGIATGLTAQELADLVAFLHEPEPEPEFGEWRRLWNGVDLEGWVPHLRGADADPSQVWSVEEGVLVCRGNPIGYIRTEEEFTNFQLELQWRFDPAKGAGNSGVLLRVHGDDKVWPDSIEAQLMSRNAGDIWNIGEFPMATDVSRTSGRRTSRREPSNERPLGEWNTYRITMNHGSLTLEVNGLVQNTAEWCAEIPGFIALQSEGAEIHFRNIRLRPIR